MQTVFFIKKGWGRLIISQVLSIFVFIILLYAAFLNQSESVWIGKTFYFLVSQTEHIEAGAYDVQLQSGAGSLLEYSGREYVVWAVYLDGEDGRMVQAAIAANGENISLLQMDAEKLYFKSYREKKNASLYQGALNCLYGCMEVLGLEIERLDNGATQQSSKRTLSLLLKQLLYLPLEYETEFVEYANICKDMAESLNEVLLNTIYTKDLRYLMCDMAIKYLQLTSKFLI